MAGHVSKASFVCIFMLSFGGNAVDYAEQSTISHLLELIETSPECVAQIFSSCAGNETSTVNPNEYINQEIYELQTSFANLQNNLRRPRSCDDLYHEGDRTSGVRTIYPFPCCNDKGISVYCDQTTDGGGWTVIQHREDLPIREKFSRKWIEYQLGFGNLTGEFWLGLENIYALVNQKLMELRVDLEDFNGDKRWAKYEYMHISNSEDNYRLDVGEYSGNAGDGFEDRHVGYPFSTKDKDNDDYKDNCAEKYQGGWWYDQCHISNLNGFPRYPGEFVYAKGIHWYPFTDYKRSLKTTTLSLRPAHR